MVGNPTAETKVWKAAADWAQANVENAANYSTTACRARAMGAFLAGYAFAKGERRRREKRRGK